MSATRVAIVTGGAQGIGRGIVSRLVEERWRVVAVDASREGIEDATNNLGPHKLESVRFVEGSCADPNVAAAAVNMATESFGQLDLLVNNAGGGGLGVSFDDQSLDYFLSVVNSNLTACYVNCKAAVPELRKVDGSCIVNIASTRALMSEPSSEPYAASKGGIVALTHALAASLGPKVRVNCICPGWIDVSGPEWGVGRTQHPLSTKDHEQHWAGRVGCPDDIAEAVLFLYRSRFVTGQSIVVDGGMTKKMIYHEDE